MAKGGVIEGDPKSMAGRRSVHLPAPVVEELKAHMETFTAPEADAFVFTSARGKPVERSNFRGRVWKPAVEAVGLDALRFHDMRHSAGTLGAQTGATTKELMGRLGHSSSRAAMIYQHASEERDQRIADRLAEMVAEQAAVESPKHPGGARLGHESPSAVEESEVPGGSHPC